MTGFGFIGPMTAMGTTFDAKAEAEVATTATARYRYGYRYGWATSLLLALKGWW